MNGNNSKDDQRRDLDEVIEQQPQAKHGEQGEAANEGRQAGANSARTGEPIAPQTGEPIEHSH
jgi:hypothetical protein